MGRHSKNLSGQGARLFVSKAVEYTDDTTIVGFSDNAVEGEIGVFLDTGAVRTTALTSGLKFYIAQKRDGLVHRTPILDIADLTRKLRTAYDAPAKQVSTVGYNGTSGDVAISFTGASSTSPIDFGIEIRDTSPGNQPFPIQEAHIAITSSTYDEYTALADLCKQLNADFDYEGKFPDRFVKVEIVSNGTKTNLTNGATVVNGSVNVTSTAHGLSVGNLIELNDIVYKVATVVSANAITIDRPYQGSSETIAAGANAASIAYTSGTTLLGLRITAIRNETHFTVTVTGGLADAPKATATSWKLGSGAGASIVDWEKEAIFFDGVGSTENAAFRDDYGRPTLFADSTKNYHLIFLDFAPSITPSAAMPVYKQHQIQRVVIACPTDATTPDNELTTIFGV